MITNSHSLLDQILERYESSRNIREKRKIQPIIELIKKHSYHSDQIYASLGEDAAAVRISPDSDQLILLTTDAIIPEFIQASPWAVGYAAIYVGIDDIVACGGRPIACSTTISYNNAELGNLIFKGILEATQKFALPLIRGHTSTDATALSLTSTVIGISTIDQYISAGGARIGDKIGLIYDREGKKGKYNPLYWDTITEIKSEVFWQKRSFFNEASIHLWINACKDISNGGILGTLYQLLSYAGLGARIDLNQLSHHHSISNMGYNLVDFLFAYLTSSFLVSVQSNKCTEVESIVNKKRMSFMELGEVVERKNIEISYDGLKKSIELL